MPPEPTVIETTGDQFLAHPQHTEPTWERTRKHFIADNMIQ